MNTLLVIFAHPDDESHGPGGTLAKYAAEGVKVHYLCATRGEAGTVDSDQLHGRTVAELRTSEMENAAAILGLTSVKFMDYRDSGMAGSPDSQHPQSLYNAPLEEVAGKIADAIRQLRPDVIITHDQYGWYGHPDHIKCYLATLRAYEMLYGLHYQDASGMSGSANAPRLYVASFSKWMLKLTIRMMPFFGRDPHRHGQNHDVDLVKIASWEVLLTARVHVTEYLPVVDRAISAHASQQPLAQSKNALLKAIMRQMESVESFSRIYPPVAPGESIEDGLFDTAPSPRQLKLTTGELPTPA